MVLILATAKNKPKRERVRHYSSCIDTADNIALDAVQVYLEVLKHKRLLALAEDNLASHEETLTKIRKRSNSGAGRRSQLEQTEGRVARARASLIAQQNNLEDALTGMHEILGRYVQATQLTLPNITDTTWGKFK